MGTILKVQDGYVVVRVNKNNKLYKIGIDKLNFPPKEGDSVRFLKKNNQLNIVKVAPKEDVVTPVISFESTFGDSHLSGENLDYSRNVETSTPPPTPPTKYEERKSSGPPIESKSKKHRPNNPREFFIYIMDALSIGPPVFVSKAIYILLAISPILVILFALITGMSSFISVFTVSLHRFYAKKLDAIIYIIISLSRFAIFSSYYGILVILLRILYIKIILDVIVAILKPEDHNGIITL